MAYDGPSSRKWLPSREVMHSTTSASAPRRRSITLFLPLFLPFASFLASNSNPPPEKPFGVAYAYYPIVYKSVLALGVYLGLSQFTFSHIIFIQLTVSVTLKCCHRAATLLLYAETNPFSLAATTYYNGHRRKSVLDSIFMGVSNIPPQD